MRHFKGVAVFAFILVLVANSYINLLNAPPQSSHAWRQSDCAAIAYNYYDNGMDFFSIGTFNLSGGNYGDSQSVSEFPILYYTVAIAYQIFGTSNWVYRMIWTGIYLIGFYAFLSFNYRFLQKKILSTIISLVLFSSPMLIFYGNSFIADVPALSFSMVAWWCFSLYVQNKKYSYLCFSALFFLLAALLKITAFINFAAVLLVFFLEHFSIKKHQPIFSKNTKTYLTLLAVPLLIVLWYLWAKNYNSIHENQYFAMRPCPIWGYEMCAQYSIGEIFKSFRVDHFPNLYHKSIFILVLGCIFYLLWQIKKVKPLFLMILFTYFLATITYVLLWYGAFYEHDYYFINLLPLIFFIVLAFFHTLQKQHPTILKSKWLYPAIVILLFFCFKHNIKRTKDRMNSWRNEIHFKNENLRNFAQSDAMNLIPKNSKVIVIPDQTPNYSLNILKRKGWTYDFSQQDLTQKMQLFIQNGADYILVNKNFSVEQVIKEIQPYTGEKIYDQNNIKIYQSKK